MSANVDPMQPAFEVEGMPELIEDHQRFDPNQRRAFGSVPRLLGAKLDIPQFERLDNTAYEDTSAEGLHRDLFVDERTRQSRRRQKYYVDGVILSVDEYGAIVRNPEKFLDSIQAATLASGNASNDVRLQEKELKSGYHSFRHKWQRQKMVVDGLNNELKVIDTLREWQKTPGYARSSEVDIVALAGHALNGTFYNMLKTIKDSRQLSAEQLVDRQHALNHRLFRGPQDVRMDNWGATLQVAHNYTFAKKNVFMNRQRRVERFGHRLANDLNDFYQKHGILESV